jgi:hypothetical protein
LKLVQIKPLVAHDRARYDLAVTQPVALDHPYPAQSKIKQIPAELRVLAGSSKI